MPRTNDIWQERLYCIQWMTKASLDKGGRVETYFAGVTDADVARERRVEAIVRERLEHWQAQGLVPDMPIETGAETARLKRERGWTYWRGFLGPRHLLVLAILVLR